MKAFFLFSLLAISFFSCKKEEPSKITYDKTGDFGTNILAMNSDTTIVPGNYSMRATVPDDRTLKVKLSQVEGGTWWLSLGSEGNWSFNDLENGQQIFDASSGVTNDIKLDLTSLNGKFAVWIYDNADSYTSSKLITVQ